MVTNYEVLRDNLPTTHNPFRPHRVHFYVLLFITKGEGWHFVDFKKYPYKRGSIIFIAKGQVHAFEKNENRKETFFSFTEKFLDKSNLGSNLMQQINLYNYHLYSPLLQLEASKIDFFERTLGYIDLNIKTQAYTEWSYAGGLKAMEDILVAHPDINVVITESDVCVLGAIKAIAQAGKLTAKDTLVHDVSFAVKVGEVLGIAGLGGSGRTETAKLIFGADKKKAGKMFLNGAEISTKSPADAVTHNIGLVSEDRKEEGVFLPLSIRKNISVTDFKAISERFGFINEEKENSNVQSLIVKLNIKTPSAVTPVKNLSGGEQMLMDSLKKGLCYQS